MFIPQSCFFTDPDSVSQTNVQSFGPKSADVFAITARFQSTGAQAYAICKGCVFVQPQTGNSGLVNIVLRPYTQPITGLNIRYFVYRGLRMADFFDGPLVLSAAENRSDFINRVNKAFDDFYAEVEGTKPDFASKFIGFDPDNQPDGSAIDQFFFKESQYTEVNGEETEEAEGAFELPLVQEGMSLGSFAQGECGMDVVLSYGDYALENPVDEFLFDLAYARGSHATIDLSDVADEHQKKRIGEQVCQFVDVAAFYGLHVANGTVSVYDGGVKARYTGTAIYDAVVSRFHTQNHLYLYIQADRGRSYNYYGNYSLQPVSTFDLQVGDGPDTLTETNFGTYGWPVHIIQSTQAHNEPHNLTHIRLVADGNPEAMLYVQVGELTNAVKNNFMDAAGLAVPDDPERLTTNAYTLDLILSNPAVGTTTKNTVATFNILIYQGTVVGYDIYNEDESTEVQTIPRNFFDDVFDLLTATPLLKTSAASGQSTLVSQRLKPVRFTQNGQSYGIAVVQTNIVQDTLPVMDSEDPLQRVVYVTDAVDFLNGATSLTETLSPQTSLEPSAAQSVTSDNAYGLTGVYTYQLQEFTDSMETIKGVRLMSADSYLGNKVILGLTKEENDRLKSVIAGRALINSRLFLIDLFEGTNQLVSPENIHYQKYRAAIAAEDTSGNPKLYLPDTDVIVYSLDGVYHFTRGYTEYMEPYTVLTDLTIDLTL